jgi:hypothetical protein
MADRYDPKLSVRPPGERKATEPTAEADPLAELARMVSGREPGGRGRGDERDRIPEGDVERDLEAELLNDLQASFAALSGPLAVAPEAAEEAAAPEREPESEPAEMVDAPSEPAAEEDDGDDSEEPEPLEAPPALPEPVVVAAAPRSVEPRPDPRKPEPFSFDISQAFDEAEAAAARVVRAEQQQARRPEREPRPYAPPLRGPASPPRQEPPAARPEASAARPAPSSRVAIALPPRGEAGVPARAEVALPPRGERGATPERPAVRRPAPPARNERPNLPVRPLPMDDDGHDEDVPIPRVVASRAPRLEPTAPPPSRFAPQRMIAPPPPPPQTPPVQARRRPEPEPPHGRAEEDFELELADLPGEEGPFEDEFTLDDLELGEYDHDDEFPPFPEDDLSGRGRRRSGRVFALVAGVLAIVAVGGAAVFLFRGDGGAGSPPPIIAADEGPTKVAGDQTGVASETDAQSKLIYDRVDEAGSSGDTRLVTGESEIGSIPSDDGAASDNPISRVIIPGGPGIDQPMADTAGNVETTVADAGLPPVPGDESQSEIGPRMVRTVVVKPDGTIISSEATGVDENGNAVAGVSDEDPAATDDLLLEVPRSEMDNVLEGGDLVVNTDPLGQPTPEPAATTEVATAEPEPLPSPAAPEVPDLPAPQPEPPAAAAPEPAPEPVRTAPPQQLAARDTDGPIDLTPGTAPAGGPAAGGALVQVAAQRSEEAALSSYRSLQQRYPSILGAFQPRIVRADLGEKGVYYRVRVGPFSDTDAARLCGDLKAAGGDCILAR